MEVLGGIASVTQLAVYTHTAWRAFTKLCAELRGGPLAWQEHVTNIEHLIQVTKRLSFLSDQAQLSASDQITKLVYELFELAQQALDTIGKANTKIFGICWSAAGKTELLNHILKSLKEKRKVLSFVLWQDNLSEVASISRSMSLQQEHLKGIRMDQGNLSRDMVASNAAPKLELTMTSTQVGNGTTMISNNGLGHILEQIHGSVRLNASSAGDGVVVNTNNVYMDPEVIKKQLEIAEMYARGHNAEQRNRPSMGRERARSAEPKQQRLALGAPP